MVHTQKKDGSFTTVIDNFGVGPWDEAIYIPAGLALEGNRSAEFYDYGMYPQNVDNYTRHLLFKTVEEPNLTRIIQSGKALIGWFEMTDIHDDIIKNTLVCENVIGLVAVQAVQQQTPFRGRMV